ncbi:MAG: lipase family protein [Rhodopila sp.]
MSIFTQLPEPLYLRQRPTVQTVDTGFALDTALAMAWASQLAYETNDPDKVQRVLASWGGTLRGFHVGRISSVLPLTSAKGFIAAREGVSILTFAGTEPSSLADWILDFSIHMNVDGVHDGFEKGVGVVWDTISRTLDADGPAAADKVLITGHSLGGALAAVAALRLAKHHVVDLDRLLGVYTFGMPRIGNKIFTQEYRAVSNAGLADRTYRIVHGVDIVLQVPPSEAPFGFRHIGSMLACAHGASFDSANLVSDTHEQVPSDETALSGLLQGLLRKPPTADLPAFPGDRLAALVIDSLPPSIRDHLMDRYLRALGSDFGR